MDCSKWSTSSLSIHMFNIYMKSSSTKPKVSSSLLGGISHLGGALLKDLSQSNSNGVNTTVLYVKVVTPLVLKRWVWPMIKCSHLTPKSIYSYIDDLVIANCLIDARIGCACFATYFICHFIVWACWLHILFIRGHPLVDLIDWFPFLWPSGWTRMPKNFL